MKDKQIENVINNHVEHNKSYYRKFVFGQQAPVRNRPSPQDLEKVIQRFKKRYGSGIYTPYAERISIVELNP